MDLEEGRGDAFEAPCGLEVFCFRAWFNGVVKLVEAEFEAVVVEDDRAIRGPGILVGGTREEGFMTIGASKRDA